LGKGEKKKKKKKKSRVKRRKMQRETTKPSRGRMRRGVYEQGVGWLLPGPARAPELPRKKGVAQLLGGERWKMHLSLKKKKGQIQKKKGRTRRNCGPLKTKKENRTTEVFGLASGKEFGVPQREKTQKKSEQRRKMATKNGKLRKSSSDGRKDGGGKNRGGVRSSQPGQDQ